LIATQSDQFIMKTRRRATGDPGFRQDRHGNTIVILQPALKCRFARHIETAPLRTRDWCHASGYREAPAFSSSGKYALAIGRIGFFRKFEKFR